MVTGAYYPELSGASLQCRELVRRLRTSIRFTILTTTADRTLPALDEQDGVPVHRVFIDPSNPWSKIVGALRFTRVVLSNRHRFSIVHLHGFSQKSILLVWLARLSRRPVVLKLTSVGHDDPVSMKARGGLAYRCYMRAALYVGVSSRMKVLYERVGVPLSRFRLIPNGVDLDRFRSRHSAERQAMRRQLGLSGNGLMFLFVGFFSTEKCPDKVFDAWASLAKAPAAVGPLVFVGATRSRYYEVDRELAEQIRLRARVLNLESRVIFVEKTLHIDRYYGAADIFVLASLREGLPNALMEAMASGMACVSSHLEGVTEDLIEDGVNGLLTPPGDVPALEAAFRFLVEHPDRASEMGIRARETIEARFGIERIAQQYLEAYRTLSGRPACAA